MSKIAIQKPKIILIDIDFAKIAVFAPKMQSSENIFIAGFYVFYARNWYCRGLSSIFIKYFLLILHIY